MDTKDLKDIFNNIHFIAKYFSILLSFIDRDEFDVNVQVTICLIQSYLQRVDELCISLEDNFAVAEDNGEPQ